MRTWTKRDPVKNYFPLPNEIYQLVGLSNILDSELIR